MKPAVNNGQALERAWVEDYADIAAAAFDSVREMAKWTNRLPYQTY